MVQNPPACLVQCFTHILFIYYVFLCRAWIFISKGMMVKLSLVKTSMQPCVMQIMLNCQTFYNGTRHLSSVMFSRVTSCDHYLTVNHPIGTLKPVHL